MAELHFPWLQLMIATPTIGALWLATVRDPERVWKYAFVITAITLLLSLCAWQDLRMLQSFEAHDRWDVVTSLWGLNSLVIDQISAPLLALAALLYFLVTLATLRTKFRRFPFALNLVSLSLLLALLNCRAPWGIIALLAAQAVPPWWELRAQNRSTRVFSAHMLLAIALLAGSWAMISARGQSADQSMLPVAMLAAAVLIRSGVVPVHCWVTDLFENVTLGSALLFVAPMPGAYAAVRLVLPIAPESILRGVMLLSLVTAVYAACMALIQREARRCFAYLFLSNASLVLVGLEVATPISFTGGLALWLSGGMSLAGLGLTLRALETRCGRLSLGVYHGLYDHMPSLAVFFLLTGLASIGFPGTIGFIGAELLVEGAVQRAPYVGVLVVLAAALNGIAVMRAYFRLFTGSQHTSSFSLEARWPEKIAVLTMTLLIIAGGFAPQPGIASRYRAATEAISRRQAHLSHAARLSHAHTLPDVAEWAASHYSISHEWSRKAITECWCVPGTRPSSAIGSCSAAN
jgi:NADH-quinone oxidoreductase subunit M